VDFGLNICVSCVFVKTRNSSIRLDHPIISLDVFTCVLAGVTVICLEQAFFLGLSRREGGGGKSEWKSEHERLPAGIKGALAHCISSRSVDPGRPYLILTPSAQTMGKSQKKRSMRRRHNPMRVPDSHLPKGLAAASSSSNKTEAVLPIIKKVCRYLFFSFFFC
jgi:hypothetical protein